MRELPYTSVLRLIKRCVMYLYRYDWIGDRTVDFLFDHLPLSGL